MRELINRIRQDRTFPCPRIHVFQKPLVLLALLLTLASGTSFAQIQFGFTSGFQTELLPGGSFIDVSGVMVNFGSPGIFTLDIQQAGNDDFDITNLSIGLNSTVVGTGSNVQMGFNTSFQVMVSGIVPLSADPCDEGRFTMRVFKFGNEVGSFTYTVRAVMGATDRGDLLMRDDAFDTGAEPYVPSIEFASPDLWVRRQADGITSHQNPDFVSQSGNANRVYARIRNIGCQTSQASDLHLYWTRARTHETWDDHWLHFSNPSAPNNFAFFPSNSTNKVPLGGEITIANPQNASSSSSPVNIPALSPGQTHVISPVSWFPPDPQWYDNDGDPIVAVNGAIHPAICLLARAVSNEDPMNNELNPRDVVFNVRDNNNIVTRNTYVTNDPSYKWDPDGIGSYNYGWTSYGVNNPTGTVEIVDLGLTISSIDTEDPFQTYGNVNVALSNGLWAAWAAAGSRGSGFQVISDGLVRITDPQQARLEGIRLNPGDDFQIAFQFDFFGVATVESDLDYNFQLGQYPNGSQNYMGSLNHMITTVEARAGKRSTARPNAPMVMELNAYPNPAGESATISFTLTEASQVSLILRDLQGREVVNVASNQEFSEGQHSIALDLSKVRAGVYFLNLQTPDQFLTEKVVHTR